MASKFAFPSPLFAPGKQVKDFLDMGLYTIKSDAINYNSASPVSTFDVDANTLVVGVIVQIVTAFVGTSPVLSIGVAGSTARHLATSDVTTTATGFTAIFKPFDYTSAATIITTIGGTGLSAGVARVWLVYRAKSDLQFEG